MKRRKINSNIQQCFQLWTAKFSTQITSLLSLYQTVKQKKTMGNKSGKVTKVKRWKIKGILHWRMCKNCRKTDFLKKNLSMSLQRQRSEVTWKENLPFSSRQSSWEKKKLLLSFKALVQYSTKFERKSRTSCGTIRTLT